MGISNSPDLSLPSVDFAVLGFPSMKNRLLSGVSIHFLLSKKPCFLYLCALFDKIHELNLWLSLRTPSSLAHMNSIKERKACKCN